jgi:hypothetical protein
LSLLGPEPVLGESVRLPPRNLVQLAILVEMAGSRMSGAMRILEPVFGTLARWGRREGVERAPLARYCAW